MFLIGTWETQFELDKAEAGRLAGIGIWPFAVSIILFSLVIDRIGYKTAMYVAFIGHAIWTVMAVSAYYVDDKETAYGLLYWGSLICALANGTVEAFINPVVATMFSKEKTKWLNILHAGWPAGLVITGLLLIAMGDTTPWAVKVGLIGIPAVAYFVILVGLKFPESERVTSGVSYREMLQEFGVSGAVIVAFLLVLQLMDFFSSGGSVELSGTTKGVFIGMGVLMVAAFGLYTQTFGRPFLFFMIIIMMPLATTEIGTDGWITNIMEGIAKSEGFDPGWILVYTSAIMLILRFFAGPIVHTVSPLGLLAISAMLAVAGLFYLSTAEATAIFFAATLYGFGKTFFWPTMLGVVSEQCPKGGALTLNAISGIGMLAVGTLGFPFIGTMQEKAQQKAIVSHEELPKQVPGLVVEGNVKPVTDKTIYEVLEYSTIDEKAVEALVAKLPEKAPSEKDWDQAKAKAELKLVKERSSQRALAGMAFFPAFMLVCYIALIFYFKTRGGYVAEELTGHSANDEKYTGGVAGAVE
jgi:MFS family permease